MMYILDYEINTPCPDDLTVETIKQVVGTTIHRNLGSTEGHFRYMLIGTNDSNPHCRWMFVSR